MKSKIMKTTVKLVLGGFATLAVLLSCNQIAEKQVNTKVANVTASTSEPQALEQNTKTEGSPDITFKTYEANFGNIKQGDSFEYDFEFTNTGDADLVITDARGSCGCTVPEYPRTAIAPGETGVIHVRFNSAGKSGNQVKTVTLNTNASPTPVTLYIKGTVDVINQ
jgi:hypothetical protein